MVESELNTVIELELWLKENCYPMHSYSINGNFIYEGCGLENKGSHFEWYYTERGERNLLEIFDTEKEAVQFALKQIKEDEHSNRNFIGMYKSNKDVDSILLELKKRKVEYWTDIIPYGGTNDLRKRIFVIGCGIKKVQDLINKK